jgi:hypothetical protein
MLFNQMTQGMLVGVEQNQARQAPVQKLKAESKSLDWQLSTLLKK